MHVDCKMGSDVVPNNFAYLQQGGDFTQGNGMGGESIYGEHVGLIWEFEPTHLSYPDLDVLISIVCQRLPNTGSALLPVIAMWVRHACCFLTCMNYFQLITIICPRYLQIHAQTSSCIYQGRYA